MVHRHVGSVGAVHTEHTEKTRLRSRIGAQAHERVGYGEIKIIDQFA